MSEAKAIIRPLKAVFFMEHLPMLAPLIAAWAQAGHRISSVVMLKRPNSVLDWHAERLHAWYAPQWSLPTQVHRHTPDAAIIRLPQPIEWSSLARRLAALEADVLISAFFPRRIPEALFSIFPFGGVNLHPALLPYYRGPSPLQHLLLQDAWREFGGVTLHRMSVGLDEGGLIATAKLTEEHWRDRQALNRALAGAMANLVGRAVPAYCGGEAPEVPQPQGGFMWTGEDVDMTVNKGWHAEHLKRLLTFFGRRPGVYLPIGEKRIELGSELMIIGRPTGEPPQRSNNSVEFDLMDARVSCARPSWQELVESNFRSILAQHRSMPPDIPFSYASMQIGKNS